MWSLLPRGVLPKGSPILLTVLVLAIIGIVALTIATIMG
jgi:hypothetical protein